MSVEVRCRTNLGGSSCVHIVMMLPLRGCSEAYAGMGSGRRERWRGTTDQLACPRALHRRARSSSRRDNPLSPMGASSVDSYDVMSCDPGEVSSILCRKGAFLSEFWRAHMIHEMIAVGNRAMWRSTCSKTARLCTGIMGFPSTMVARTTSRICAWCPRTAIVSFTAPAPLLGCVEGLSRGLGDGSARFCGGGVMATSSRYSTSYRATRPI
jgi:hypothetical protein